MSTIGQKERKTQQRVVKLFREKLGYAYLGNWEEREINQNIQPEWLRICPIGAPSAKKNARPSNAWSGCSATSLVTHISVIGRNVRITGISSRSCCASG